MTPGCVGGRFPGSRLPALISVIICDFDFIGMAFLPYKTNTILLVDSDAVLIFSVAFQRLKSVAWRDVELNHISNPVNLIQLSLSHRPNGLGTAFSGGLRIMSVKNILCACIFKRLYHGSYYNGVRYSRQWDLESGIIPPAGTGRSALRSVPVLPIRPRSLRLPPPARR